MAAGAGLRPAGPAGRRQYLAVNQNYVNAEDGTQNAYDTKYSSCMRMAEMSNR